MYHVHHYIGRTHDPRTGQLRHCVSEEPILTLQDSTEIDDFYHQVRDKVDQPREYLIYWKADDKIQARRAAIARTNGRGKVRASSTTIRA